MLKENDIITKIIYYIYGYMINLTLRLLYQARKVKAKIPPQAEDKIEPEFLDGKDIRKEHKLKLTE